jgi:hypothetical protein
LVARAERQAVQIQGQVQEVLEKALVAALEHLTGLTQGLVQALEIRAQGAAQETLGALPAVTDQELVPEMAQAQEKERAAVKTEATAQAEVAAQGPAQAQNPELVAVLGAEVLETESEC